MRKLWTLLALLPTLCFGELLDYNTAATIQGALYLADGTALVSSDPTFQDADCNYILDGGAATSCGSGVLTWEGNGAFSLDLPQAATNGATVTVIISDNSGSAFLDWAQTFRTYNNTSAGAPNIGNDALLAECVEDADTTCLDLREVLCYNLAEAVGRGDNNTGTSTWTIADPSNTQTRVTIVYGTDPGDRTSVTLSDTDCT